MQPALLPGLVRGLLPAYVAVAEGVIGGLGEALPGPLWPEEAAHVARAVASRRTEFAAGRALARRALSALGCREGPIPPGERGAPRWPAGFTGSISHTARYAAAAAARLDAVAAIGIDVEEVGRLTGELESYMFTPGEILRHLLGREPGERQATAAAMFCAKEAYYKAQYPVTGRWLGFHDVELDLDRASGAFEVWRVERPERRRPGRWAMAGGLAAAALWRPGGASDDW